LFHKFRHFEHLQNRKLNSKAGSYNRVTSSFVLFEFRDKVEAITTVIC